jgi:hypothetical protein
MRKACESRSLCWGFLAGIFLGLAGCGTAPSTPAQPFSGMPGHPFSKDQSFTVADGVTLLGNPIGGKTESEVRALVELLAYRLDRKPSNAYVRRDTLTIIPEEKGRKVDVEATLKTIRQSAPGTRVQPVIRTLLPPITIKDLASAVPTNCRAIARCFVPIFERPSPYKQELQRVAARLNNSVLAPGESFSLHQQMGGSGLSPAKMEPVASLLHSAVVQAGLKASEWQPGMEQDVRFSNTARGTLLIKSGVEADRLYIILYEKKASP